MQYFHPDAEEVLADTYGLMIYQESVMRVAQKFAGYSLAEADNLRKACGKKNREIMAKERAGLRRRCRANTGYGEQLGTELFDIIEKFADYAFNKSHSYGYGLISYQTAYLKANYPAEYFSALLTSVKSSLEKAAIYLAECRVMEHRRHRAQMSTAPIRTSLRCTIIDAETGVTDALRSASDCQRFATLEPGPRRTHRRGTQRDANGPFADFYDFCERVNTQRPQQTHHRIPDQGRRLRFLRSPPTAVCSPCSNRSSTRRWRGDASVTWGSCLCSATSRTRPRSAFRRAGERSPIIEFDKKQRLAFEKEMLGSVRVGSPAHGRRAVAGEARSIARIVDLVRPRATAP